MNLYVGLVFCEKSRPIRSYGFCVNLFGSVCVCACGIWFICEASRVWAYDHSSGHMFCMYVDEIL